MNFKQDRNRIILIPDSFKGTISATEICQIMETSVKKFLPDMNITDIPIADGGEGTVDALVQAAGGKIVNLKVKGPLGETIDSFYGVLKDGTAIIEMAAAAGLPLLEKTNVMETTTYGVGELISHALENGHRHIIIGLGGSATNDGGVGACAALGFRFLNKQGESFIPTGKNLSEIAKIDMSKKNSALSEAEITLMVDVNNPLCGEKGAAHIFGPQKGADTQDIEILDEGLRNLAAVLKRDHQIDILNIAGSGAAGGMGGGFYGMLNAKMRMGIDVILETVKFTDLLSDTALAFTGEGKIDSQTLGGKVIAGIAERTKQAEVPLIAVVGDIGDNMEKAYEIGVTAIFSTNRVAVPFREAKKRAKSDLSLTMDEIMRVLVL